MTNVKFLQKKLGVILFQLPPGWKYNEERFSAFCQKLSPEFRYTFEFRNHSWYNESAYEILKANNIAFCIYELEHHLSPIISTANFVYVRLHGPDGKYAGSYSKEQLNVWAIYCRTWSVQGKDVYFYFDNDQLGYAAHNAILLQQLVKKPL